MNLKNIAPRSVDARAAHLFVSFVCLFCYFVEFTYLWLCLCTVYLLVYRHVKLGSLMLCSSDVCGAMISSLVCWFLFVCLFSGWSLLLVVLVLMIMWTWQWAMAGWSVSVVVDGHFTGWRALTKLSERYWCRRMIIIVSCRLDVWAWLVLV